MLSDTPLFDGGTSLSTLLFFAPVLWSEFWLPIVLGLVLLGTAVGSFVLLGLRFGTGDDNPDHEGCRQPGAYIRGGHADRYTPGIVGGTAPDRSGGTAAGHDEDITSTVDLVTARRGHR